MLKINYFFYVCLTLRIGQVLDNVAFSVQKYEKLHKYSHPLRPFGKKG